MTAFWRAAGLTYINYSSIAAKVTRQALKPALVDAAKKRGTTSIKFQRWEGGKPVGAKYDL